MIREFITSRRLCDVICSVNGLCRIAIEEMHESRFVLVMCATAPGLESSASQGSCTITICAFMVIHDAGTVSVSFAGMISIQYDGHWIRSNLIRHTSGLSNIPSRIGR